MSVVESDKADGMHIDPTLVSVPPVTVNPQTLQPAAIATVHGLLQAHSHYASYPQMYTSAPVHTPTHNAPRPLDTSTAAPDPQQWQQDDNHGIIPHHTHMIPPVADQRPPYREDAWDGYGHSGHTSDALEAQGVQPYDFRYREDSWEGGAYYDPTTSVRLIRISPAYSADTPLSMTKPILIRILTRHHLHHQTHRQCCPQRLRSQLVAGNECVNRY
jgi:hypothetical protein